MVVPLRRALSSGARLSSGRLALQLGLDRLIWAFAEMQISSETARLGQTRLGSHLWSRYVSPNSVDCCIVSSGVTEYPVPHVIKDNAQQSYLYIRWSFCNQERKPSAVPRHDIRRTCISLWVRIIIWSISTKRWKGTNDWGDVLPLEAVIRRDGAVQGLLIPYFDEDNLWDVASSRKLKDELLKMTYQIMEIAAGLERVGFLPWSQVSKYCSRQSGGEIFFIDFAGGLT